MANDVTDDDDDVDDEGIIKNRYTMCTCCVYAEVFFVIASVSIS